MFHFITLALIRLVSCLFSAGVTISSTFLEFSLDTDFVFKNFSEILFQINSSIDSPVLWTNVLEVVLEASSPAFAAVSIAFFPYMLNSLLANDKNSYHLTYFIALGSK